ncbi:hypothetical protein CERZMDRAFT_108740 [Cercospora zeae-maydis SCOH1-5]|uniref:MT-A70-domain-containing protein n=1 Tax=Cercospora zeae-maydis SCOH1-5 TaxID=717836 RepID=A0A6A6FU83_9PEZI|nr:hypothetical protein CERZMDRAFT_108740 [Cercospora zeae-maydis SCOH1-5]
MTTGILWQNAETTIALIDIPLSIAAAQSTKEKPWTDSLLSVAALEVPFPTQICKDIKGARNLPSNAADDFPHQEYRVLLEKALEETDSCHKGAWCQPRPFVSAKCERSHGKRKAHDVFASNQSSDLPANILSNITQSCLTPPDVHFEVGDGVDDGDYEPGSHLCYHSKSPTNMVLSHHDLDTAKSNNYKFRIPAGAAFVLANCSNPEAFHDVVNPRRLNFDFILMDPPWPNRSVKRTHKTPGTSYATISTLKDISHLLLNLNLSCLLSRTGYMGIWVTNKAAIRTLLVGPGGLFEHWEVELAEEWIWLKTTTRGEPVTPLEGTWNGKRPYEVLLVARKRTSNTTETGEIKRRVVIAVPDLHSRKPCLKKMIETLIGTDGDVLEIFARHLVAGWWSWGNECVKFNWEGYWQSVNEREKREAR